MKTYFSNPEKKQKARLLCYDALIVFLVFLFSYTFRIVVYEQGSIYNLPGRISWLVVLGVIVHVLSFYIFGLYDFKFKFNRKILLINVVLSALLASLIVALLSFAFPKDKIGRILVFVHFLFMVAIIYSWRVLYSFMRGQKEPSKPVLILGWNKLVKKITDSLSTDSGYNVAALVIPEKSEHPTKVGNHAPVYTCLESALRDNHANTIVISKKLRNLKDLKSRLVDLKFQDKEIFAGTAFYERLLGRVPVSEISEGWLLYKGQGEPFKPALYENGKRIMDFLFSACILVLSSPLFLITALLIKLDSKGPVFFKQERLGQFERPFTLRKFRTMVDKAEQQTGPCWATENDPRFTKVGKLLRKTRLDEFPQFINVLKGEMSLVGPRPIRQYYADIFSEKFPFYRLRFKVKPGITGWAQVNMAYVNTEEDQYEKLEYEFYYLYHQSLFMDLFIILKTIQSVIKMRGG